MKETERPRRLGGEKMKEKKDLNDSGETEWLAAGRTQMIP